MKEDEKIKAGMKRCFKQGKGPEVLAHLQRKYYDCHIRSDNPLRDLGKRDVVKYILDQLREK